MASMTAKSAAAKPRISSKAAPSVIAEPDPAAGGENRLQWIATAAYFKAERRGFIPGLEIDDWLDAEAEFDEQRVH